MSSQAVGVSPLTPGAFGGGSSPLSAPTGGISPRCHRTLQSLNEPLKYGKPARNRCKREKGHWGPCEFGVAP